MSGRRRLPPDVALSMWILLATIFWALPRGVQAQTGADPANAHESPPDPESPARVLQVPVLLVPGWSDTAEELRELQRRFVDSGWDSAWVRTLTFEDPVGSNREHGREVALALADLRAATGSPVVDVVAHSMGGLAVRHHLAHRDPAATGVRRVVFLATPHHGTWSALVAWGEGGEEMIPGSEFLLGLMRGAPLPPGVEALTVRTPVDLHIVPQESAQLAGVPDVQLCCPTHAGLVSDDRAFRVIQGFLVDGTVSPSDAYRTPWEPR